MNNSQITNMLEHLFFVVDMTKISGPSHACAFSRLFSAAGLWSVRMVVITPRILVEPSLGRVVSQPSTRPRSWTSQRGPDFPLQGGHAAAMYHCRDAYGKQSTGAAGDERIA